MELMDNRGQGDFAESPAYRTLRCFSGSLSVIFHGSNTERSSQPLVFSAVETISSGWERSERAQNYDFGIVGELGRLVVLLLFELGRDKEEGGAGFCGHSHIGGGTEPENEGPRVVGMYNAMCRARNREDGVNGGWASTGKHNQRTRQNIGPWGTQPQAFGIVLNK